MRRRSERDQLKTPRTTNAKLLETETQTRSRWRSAYTQALHSTGQDCLLTLNPHPRKQSDAQGSSAQHTDFPHVFQQLRFASRAMQSPNPLDRKPDSPRTRMAPRMTRKILPARHFFESQRQTADHAFNRRFQQWSGNPRVSSVQNVPARGSSNFSRGEHDTTMKMNRNNHV